MSKIQISDNEILAAGEAFLLTEVGQQFVGPVEVAPLSGWFTVRMAVDTVAMRLMEVSPKGTFISLPAVGWEECF